MSSPPIRQLCGVGMCFCLLDVGCVFAYKREVGRVCGHGRGLPFVAR